MSNPEQREEEEALLEDDSAVDRPEPFFTSSHLKELHEGLGIDALTQSVAEISQFIRTHLSSPISESNKRSADEHEGSEPQTRPRKRQRTEQCISVPSKPEQCISALNPEQHNSESESGFDPLDNNLQLDAEDEESASISVSDFDLTPSIFDDSDKVGPEVSEMLAKRVNDAFTKKAIEDKFKTLTEKYCTPKNCEFASVPRVNQALWNDLPRGAKKTDVGLQEVQKSLLHAAQAITYATDAVLQSKKKKEAIDPKSLLDSLCDSLSFYW